ncbi:MAG TPA: hypothetical protein VEU08_15945, partial [Vicinamibacterales bacterium]|nr:hypothetical protein [Vicinamibacterales bacterium]
AVLVAAPAGKADDGIPYLNVWLHYDYMVGPGYSDAPSAAAMQMVVDLFKTHGVTLHIDPQHSAIPAHRVIVPDWQSFYAATPGFDDPSCTGPDAVSFSQLAADYFQPRSNHPWHYAVFGDYVVGDPAVSPDGQPYTSHCPVVSGEGKPQPGMTGDSQVGFSDIQEGLGYRFALAMQPFRDVGLIATDVRVAALFAHELGHNLGLCHGGPNVDNCFFSALGSGANFKPNYISVMNYDFEFGIPYAATPGSTLIAGWRIDYSDAALPDLHEDCLDETAGIRGTTHPDDVTTAFGRLFPVVGPVDWNGDGNSTDLCVQRDLNGDRVRTTLTGADDWAWLHARLTPPAISLITTTARVGEPIDLAAVNVMAPALVIFAGHVTATPVPFNPDGVVNVVVPPGARSGPITIITPEGKAETSQSLTITF